MYEREILVSFVICMFYYGIKYMFHKKHSHTEEEEEEL